MGHSLRYSVNGQARLARDLGVAKSTIHRFLNGDCEPSIGLALNALRALERDLGRPLDAKEIYSVDGTYPTVSACALCGCRGCYLSGAS